METAGIGLQFETIVFCGISTYVQLFQWTRYLQKKIVSNWGAFGSILELTKMVLTLIRKRNKFNILIYSVVKIYISPWWL